MYKGVSAAYTVIVLSYWQLAFSGYWAFGSQVQPYILSSLSIPKWTIVMANLFAVFQISGCFQVYTLDRGMINSVCAVLLCPAGIFLLQRKKHIIKISD